VQNKIDEEANADERKEEKSEVRPADKPDANIVDKTQVEPQGQSAPKN